MFSIFGDPVQHLACLNHSKTAKNLELWVMNHPQSGNIYMCYDPDDNSTITVSRLGMASYWGYGSKLFGKKELEQSNYKYLRSYKHDDWYLLKGG